MNSIQKDSEFRPIGQNVATCHIIVDELPDFHQPPGPFLAYLGRCARDAVLIIMLRRTRQITGDFADGNEARMEISNRHNLIDPPDDREKRYGIRVHLAQSDPFRRLLQEQWETYHWYADAVQRDRAIEEMRKRHRYSRIGDRPTVRYEPVDR